MANIYVPHPDDISTEKLDDMWSYLRRVAFLYRIEQFVRASAPGEIFENAEEHKMWKEKKEKYLSSVSPFIFTR